MKENTKIILAQPTIIITSKELIALPLYCTYIAIVILMLAKNNDEKKS